MNGFGSGAGSDQNSLIKRILEHDPVQQEPMMLQSAVGS